MKKREEVNMTTKEKINQLYNEMKEIVGLEVLELKTLQFLQRLKAKHHPEGRMQYAPTRGINAGIYKQIVEELNQKTGKQYRWNTTETKALIRARLNDGFSPEDFKKVIFIKAKQWLGDEKFSPYLRPKTLFSSKFEDYLQEWNSYRKKEEQQKAEYDRARRIEKGEVDPEISPEELQKQKEWEELSKKLLAKASDEDYKEFYKQLKPPFKDMAYKRGLGDNLVKLYYIQWLKMNKDTHTKTLRHEEEDL
jgi:uncharacterized phage protein (TIGR02220 family)